MGNSGLKQHYETASKTGVLQLSDHKLKEIPPDVLNLCDVLRNLDLSKNRLGSIPEVLCSFKQMKQFNLDTNKIETLPENLANLKKLEMLNVSNNLIVNLPESLNKMNSLKQIYLNNNKIKAFPTQLFGLNNLEVVELANNKITEIPCGMANFYAVELNLSQNEISVIAEDMHMCPRLKILRVEENCLSLDSIRPSLLRDSKIHTLGVDGNLFETKQLVSLEGYNEYTEKYTAIKKKMF